MGDPPTGCQHLPTSQDIIAKFIWRAKDPERFETSYLPTSQPKTLISCTSKTNWDLPNVHITSQNSNHQLPPNLFELPTTPCRFSRCVPAADHVPPLRPVQPETVKRWHQSFRGNRSLKLWGRMDLFFSFMIVSWLKFHLFMRLPTYFYSRDYHPLIA